MKYAFLFFLTACAGKLTVSDMTVCADAGSTGAHCNNFLTDHPVDLDRLEWEALRFGYLCVSPGDYGSIKAEIEEACSELNCSYKQIQAIKAGFRRIDNTAH